MLVGCHPFDNLGVTWSLTGCNSWFLWVHLLVGLIAQSFCLVYWQLFLSSTSSSIKYLVGKYSIDCFGMTVPVVVTAHRVAKDTCFHPDDHLHYPPVKRHQFPSPLILLLTNRQTSYIKQMTWYLTSSLTLFRGASSKYEDFANKSEKLDFSKFC